jgi:hypothetical protein
MENIDKQRKQLEEKLIAKAMKDETFRKNLLENPKAAIEEETGIKLPEAINLKVVEENPSTFYLILPPKINPETEDELSEAELEMVSGGYDGEGGGDGGDQTGRVTCAAHIMGCFL